MQSSRVGSFIAFLGLLASGCAAPEAKSVSTSASAAPSACEDKLDVEAVRAGSLGVARLLYRCEAGACNGQESFMRGIRHAVSFEVDAQPEAALHVESSDPAVARVADLASTYDPCAERLRGWATLDARQTGRTTLSIRDASGELDTIEVVVADPALIQLRTTRANVFAFENSSSTLLATEGDAWLVLPELFDERGALLVGVPHLTWAVDDPQVAELRTPSDGQD